MRDAKIWAAEKQVALLRGEFEDIDYMKMKVDPPNDDVVTLSEFLPMFRRVRERGRKSKLSPRYIDDQDKQIERYVEPRFGDMPLQDIDEDAIDEWIDELKKEYHPLARPRTDEGGTVINGRLSSSTINNIVGHLGRILTVAFRKKKILHRPEIGKEPEDHDDDFDFLEKDELHRLFSACYGSYGNLIKVMALTGARAMEASGFQWQDYDPVRKKLRIDRQLDHRSGSRDKKGKIIPRFRPPKWRSKRWIDVPDSLAAVLNDQASLTRLQDGLIFQTEKNNPVVYELIRKRLQQACRRANLRNISPHVLRRTYISHRVMCGDSPFLVTKLAGHRSMQMTAKYYTQLGVEFRKEASSRFEEYLFGEKPEHQAEAANR